MTLNHESTSADIALYTHESKQALREAKEAVLAIPCEIGETRHYWACGDAIQAIIDRSNEDMASGRFDPREVEYLQSAASESANIALYSMETAEAREKRVAAMGDPYEMLEWCPLPRKSASRTAMAFVVWFCCIVAAVTIGAQLAGWPL